MALAVESPCDLASARGNWQAFAVAIFGGLTLDSKSNNKVTFVETCCLLLGRLQVRFEMSNQENRCALVPSYS